MDNILAQQGERTMLIRLTALWAMNEVAVLIPVSRTSPRRLSRSGHFRTKAHRLNLHACTPIGKVP
jgi:hypothetical protein